MNAAELAHALGGRRVGHVWMACCPAHDDKTPTKAAQLMDLKVYQAITDELVALAEKLPEGELYGNGRGLPYLVLSLEAHRRTAGTHSAG